MHNSKSTLFIYPPIHKLITKINKDYRIFNTLNLNCFQTNKYLNTLNFTQFTDNITITNKYNHNQNDTKIYFSLQNFRIKILTDILPTKSYLHKKYPTTYTNNL